MFQTRSAEGLKNISNFTTKNKGYKYITDPHATMCIYPYFSLDTDSIADGKKNLITLHEWQIKKDTFCRKSSRHHRPAFDYFKLRFRPEELKKVLMI